MSRAGCPESSRRSARTTQDLAALFEDAGFEAVVMPGTKELRAHVRVINPRNEVVEYLLGIGDPPGTSDPAEDGVYGVRCGTR